MRSGNRACTCKGNCCPVMKCVSVLRGGSIAKVWGYNPEVGWPSVGVNGDWDRYGVGETKTKDPGVGFKVKITRQADEDMKLFTVEVIR